MTAERALKARVHARLVRDAGTDGDGDAVRGRDVRSHLAELLRGEEPLLPSDRFQRLLGELVDEVAGLGPLEPLLADPRVTEIMVNGPDRVYVERDGLIERVPLSIDAVGISRLVERVVAPLGLRIDRSSPLVDARLPDGSRVHAVIPPLAPGGPCLTIRRFSAGTVALGAFDPGPRAEAFLRFAVEWGANVVVSGGTGAGKTTLLGALAGGDPRWRTRRHDRRNDRVAASLAPRRRAGGASGERGRSRRGGRA
jgi:pilus assembly protein CpaF